MKHLDAEKIAFNHRIIMLGFGSIGRALLPLIFEKFDMQPSQITIFDCSGAGNKVAQEFNVSFQLQTITSTNYMSVIGNQLREGDFIIDVSYDIASLAMIELCEQKGALYINTSTEPWIEDWNDNLSPALRTNYQLRENLIKLKGKTKKTAVVTHGANPGLASHFVKQGLWNMAKDNELCVSMPQDSSGWANLAKLLGIKAIHIAERDTQITEKSKVPGEFVNTWSVFGLMDEGVQPAELGWGTHESHWPHDAHAHETGSQCSIYLARPSASVRVRSWTPSLGAFHGYLITHPESISIASFLTTSDKSYRPTVHYAYSPCPDATSSMIELGGNEWRAHEDVRLLLNEITDGVDELGVLLMGNQKGAYWFGSNLSIHEARKLAPHNNATSLQVVAGIISGMIWAVDHPNEGIVEPEDMDHEYILSLALPYLGAVSGHYTDWTPLQNRGLLFAEQLDLTDPWQFVNIRVN